MTSQIPFTPDPPRRSAAAEWLPAPADGQACALVTCDCGTATKLTVIIDGDLGGLREGAFTCKCGTPHWFTVLAVTDGGRDGSDKESNHGH